MTFCLGIKIELTFECQSVQFTVLAASMIYSGTPLRKLKGNTINDISIWNPQLTLHSVVKAIYVTSKTGTVISSYRAYIYHHSTCRPLIKCWKQDKDFDRCRFVWDVVALTASEEGRASFLQCFVPGRMTIPIDGSRPKSV